MNLSNNQTNNEKNCVNFIKSIVFENSSVADNPCPDSLGCFLKKGEIPSNYSETKIPALTIPLNLSVKCKGLLSGVSLVVTNKNASTDVNNLVYLTIWKPIYNRTVSIKAPSKYKLIDKINLLTDIIHQEIRPRILVLRNFLIGFVYSLKKKKQFQKLQIGKVKRNEKYEVIFHQHFYSDYLVVGQEIEVAQLDHKHLEIHENKNKKHFMQYIFQVHIGKTIRSICIC